MIQHQLLATKLFVPRLRSGLVERLRLVDRLDDIPRRRLTLISAPAGFGKTTIIGAWLQRSGFPAAWLSLEQNDNEPVRFLSYLLAALQSLHPAVGRQIQEALSEQPLPSLHTLMTLLINDLAAVREDFLLVLDDYHVIDDAALCEAMQFFIEHVPPAVHIALTTRVDPDMPLSRFRSRGELLELRAHDLRFSTEEASAFFNAAMHLNLAPDHIAVLEAKTEGWIAGLQMAALSLEGRGEVDAYIRDFAGTDRYVLDYLLEEVIDRQPDTVKKAMLELAVLDTFTASLIEAVTGYPSGDELLELLEHANLFVISLDNRREWFRYHHLFADLLRHYLRKSRAGDIPALHRRAALWYEQQGRYIDAVEQAVAARDTDLLVALIERHWQALQKATEHDDAALLLWMSHIPEERLLALPRLCLVKGYALLASARRDELERLLYYAEIGLTRLDNDAVAREVRVQLYHLHAFLAYDQGDCGTMIAMCERALEAIAQRPAGDGTVYYITRETMLFMLGMAFDVEGSYEAARGVWEEVLDSDFVRSNISLTLTMYGNLAATALTFGQLERAAHLCDEVLRLREGIRVELHDTVLDTYAHTLYMKAYIAYERNDPTTAAAIVGDILSFYEPQMQFKWIPYLRLLANCYFLLGDRAGLERTLDQLDHLAIPDFLARYRSVAGAARVMVALHEGRAAAVETWIRETIDINRKPGQDKTHLVLVQEQLLYARYLLLRQQTDEAAGVLAGLCADLEQRSMMIVYIEALLLTAEVLCRRNRDDEALDVTARALAAAASERLLRPFVLDRKVVAPLLRRLAGSERESAIPTGFLDDVRRAVGLTVEEPPAPVAAPEGLTSRELDILRLLAQGYSNQKIADRLYISLSTVKTHLYNLFNKLGVDNRTEATVRARELGL